MKKVKLALVALIIAAGTFGIFAFTDVNEPAPELDVSATTLESTEEIGASVTLYDWYDAFTSQPLGIKSLVAQQQDCGPAGETPCAIGYELDGEGNPTGEQVQVTKTP